MAGCPRSQERVARVPQLGPGEPLCRSHPCDAAGTSTCPPQPLPPRGSFCSSSHGPGARKGPPSRVVRGTRAWSGSSSAQGPFKWLCLTARLRGSGISEQEELMEPTWTDRRPTPVRFHGLF